MAKCDITGKIKYGSAGHARRRMRGVSNRLRVFAVRGVTRCTSRTMSRGDRGEGN